ncbi:MAG TPA: hypothetical protein VIM44_01830 [Rariglobus sp.]
MKTNLSLSVILGSLALLIVSAPVRAVDAPSPSRDLDSLVSYADQLHSQGVKGPDLINKVDKRADELAEKSGQPSLHGIGAFVQQQHEQGVHGTALATAIHDELRRRGMGKGNGNPGGPGKPDTGDPGKGSPADPGHGNDHGVPGDGRKKGGK